MRFGFDTKIRYSDDLKMCDMMREIFNLYEILEEEIIKLIKNRGKMYRNGKLTWVLDIKDLLKEEKEEIFW
jgi:hypothetical protein